MLKLLVRRLMPTRTLDLRLYLSQDQHEELGWTLCPCRTLYNPCLDQRPRPREAGGAEDESAEDELDGVGVARGCAGRLR
ncbi:hypothetical protein BRD56_05965 [Thermoplasmatales archaeon SW_10_69_26]|nr:MAG: hypothetical protein BRD56_05965 [Thermoplasmatales archaeon SW_10_69_26]